MYLGCQLMHLGLDNITYRQHADDPVFFDYRQMSYVLLDHDRHDFTDIIILLCNDKVGRHSVLHDDFFETFAVGRHITPHHVPFSKETDGLFAFSHQNRADLPAVHLPYRVLNRTAHINRHDIFSLAIQKIFYFHVVTSSIDCPAARSNSISHLNLKIELVNVIIIKERNLCKHFIAKIKQHVTTL